MYFSFLYSSFLISDRCTFIMTEPSLRWRFTFFPRKDLALLTWNLSIFSPFPVLVCHSSPTSSADGAFFSSEEDVEFDLVVLALIVPRVLAVFHVCESPVMSYVGLVGCFCF